jgi:hypothetical protein
MSKKFFLIGLMLVLSACGKVVVENENSQAQNNPESNNQNNGLSKNSDCKDPFVIEGKSVVPETYTSTGQYKLTLPGDWVVEPNPVGYDQVEVRDPENQRVYNEINCGRMYGEGYMPTAIMGHSLKIEYLPENMSSIQAKTFEEYINALKKDPTVTNLKPYTLDGVKGYSLTQGGFGIEDKILLNKAGEIYSIIFGNADLPDAKKGQETVLNGFKFVK